MAAPRSVVVDAFPDSPLRHRDADAVICIDVISTTTTLVTAVAQGRRAFSAATEAEMEALTASLRRPLLAGDALTAEVPNGPAALARRSDIERPVVVLCTSGAALLANARGCAVVYVACLRNLEATAEAVGRRHARVAVLAAGASGQLRCEDQFATGRMVAALARRGFDPGDMRTAEIGQRWAGADSAILSWGSSAEDLRRRGRGEEMEFILTHLDDLSLACVSRSSEVVRLSIRQPGLAAAAGKMGTAALWPSIAVPSVEIEPRTLEVDRIHEGSRA